MQVMAWGLAVALLITAIAAWIEDFKTPYCEDEDDEDCIQN